MMRKLVALLVGGLFFLASASIILGQEITRKIVDVPKVDPAAITIDGKMNETAWQNAGHADLITATGYEIWANKYYRESLVEPEYDALYGRLLWTKDTLYAFIHIDEFVNDSTNLYWRGRTLGTPGEQWGGDQLFLGISNRLGEAELGDQYDGNVWSAPDGPYHFLILGDQVTLNDSLDSYNEKLDSVAVYSAANIARWATTIDTTAGVWDIELAIYNPNVIAQAEIGFNIGGSTGSRSGYAANSDAYGYYTWQPNVPNDPFAQPSGVPEDPGFYSLRTSAYWALLNFKPGPDDVIVRKVVEVPKVDPAAITIDGKMNETAWQKSGNADLITATGYEIWANKYYRESLVEPEYDALYGRLLWTKDTLYAFIHIDEFVNDSTNLYWRGRTLGTPGEQWGGDQLFLGISNRLGEVELGDQYDGNVWSAPDGPYHFLILGDQVTLNDSLDSYNEKLDSSAVYSAADIARWATVIDTTAGVWDIELAIYNPNVTAQAAIGFNIGGSTGSRSGYAANSDAYGYYTWQPNVPNDPFAQPSGVPEDPGFYSLRTSAYWALLNFVGTITAVESPEIREGIPNQFALSQNYPNPFNPATTIRFDLAKNGPVSLKVYNSLGQLVATLLDAKPFTAGTYEVIWNANALTSGVYFYRLEAGGVLQTKKMVLTK